MPRLYGVTILLSGVLLVLQVWLGVRAPFSAPEVLGFADLASIHILDSGIPAYPASSTWL